MNMPTTNSTHRARANARRLSSLLLIATVSVAAACNQDELLTVPTPDVVLPKDLTGAAVLPNAYAATIGDFQVAYAGSGGNVPGTFGSTEGLVIMSGLLSDELLNAETFPTRLEVDRRATNPVNNTMLPIFQLAQRARATAELVAVGYAQFDATNPNRAEVMALAGYMYILFAENYCNGVPSSVVNPDGTFKFGDPETGTQLLNRAVAKFDSAITIATAAGAGGATALNLARIGKGRALLDLDNPTGAATAVTAVPNTYVYNINHDENTSRQYNGVYTFTVTSKRFTVADKEGGNGLPFVTTNDPRVPVVRTANGFDGGTPFYRTPKYTSLAQNPARGAPTPLALGTEARLIEAEAALRAGDATTFLAKLNDARVNAKTYGDTPIPQPALTPIPASDVPADAAGRQNLLFRERAYDLYLTAHRVGDLRRLIRQYGRNAETVFPTGVYNPLGAAAGNSYGPDVNLPIPFEETNNPQYKACLDRNA
jgi:starch-binding outer membrane protein, SusD/RagB family